MKTMLTFSAGSSHVPTVKTGAKYINSQPTVSLDTLSSFSLSHTRCSLSHGPTTTSMPRIYARTPNNLASNPSMPNSIDLSTAICGPHFCSFITYSVTCFCICQSLSSSTNQSFKFQFLGTDVVDLR